MVRILCVFFNHNLKILCKQKCSKWRDKMVFFFLLHILNIYFSCPWMSHGTHYYSSGKWNTLKNISNNCPQVPNKQRSRIPIFPEIYKQKCFMNHFFMCKLSDEFNFSSLFISAFLFHNLNSQFGGGGPEEEIGRLSCIKNISV